MSFFDRFWPKWAASAKYAGPVLEQGNVYAGRQDAWPGAPDFLLQVEDISTSKDSFLWGGRGGVFCRKIVCADKGDPTEVVMRRAGPDNAAYNDQSNAVILDGTRIGTQYWQSWGKAKDGTWYWTPRDGSNGWMACAYVKAAGDQNENNRGGRYKIDVTPKGKTVEVERLEIDGNGDLWYNFPSKGWKKLSVDNNGFLKAT